MGSEELCRCFVVTGTVPVMRSRMFPNCFLYNACVYCTYTVDLDMSCIFFKRFTMSEIVQTTAACAHDVKQTLLAQAFIAQAFLTHALLIQLTHMYIEV